MMTAISMRRIHMKLKYNRIRIKIEQQQQTTEREDEKQNHATKLHIRSSRKSK